MKQSSAVKPIDIQYQQKFAKGLTVETVLQISILKGEPEWMTKYRLQAYDIFQSLPMPTWGVDLSDIDFNEVIYYQSLTDKKTDSWTQIPKDVKHTYDQLGIPQAEQNLLSGVSAQFESEVIYKGIKKNLSDQGVIFLDTDSALKQYPQLFHEYFGKIVPYADNKFAALNSAVWSGGTFIYIPKGLKVDLPLQAYFLINTKNTGQFERTLIIADEGSDVHYVEGCTAPIYDTNSLHSAVVEVFVKKNARVLYTTVQNWSKNVYNLTTKRAKVLRNGTMQWTDANLGSKSTMKYPCCILAEPYSKGEMLSISFAGPGQHQDTGAKMIHLAKNTTSRIISKSISKGGGRTSYRGLVQINPKAANSSTFVSCDALLIDSESRSDTYPRMFIAEKDTTVQHEATVEKMSDEKIFYMLSRGVKKEEAESLIANGFIEPIVKKIPIEYAVEMNRLLQIEMSGKIG